MAFGGSAVRVLAAAAALVGVLQSAAALPLRDAASRAPLLGAVAPDAGPHERMDRLDPLTRVNVSEKDSIEPYLRAANAARNKVLLGPPRTNISIALARKTHDLELEARLSRPRWDLAALERTLQHACALRSNVSAALPRTRSMVRALVRTGRDMDDRLMNYTATLAEMRRLQRLRFAVNVPAPLRRELGNVAHASRVERPRLQLLLRRTHAFRERVETLARRLHSVVRETRLLRWSCTHGEAAVGLIRDAVDRVEHDFAEVAGGVATLRLKHRDCQRRDQQRWASHIKSHSHRDLAEGDDASVTAHLSVYRLYLALDDCLREVWHGDLMPVQRALAAFSARAKELGDKWEAARSEVTRTHRRSRDNAAEHERIRRTAATLPHGLTALLRSVQAEVHRLTPMLRVHDQIMRQHGEEWRQLYEQRNLTMHQIMHELTRERREEVQRKLEFEYKRQVRLNEEEEKLKARLVKIRKQSLLDSWFYGNYTVPDLPPVPNATHVDDGPSCSSYTGCTSCVAVEWCGWCGMTAECMEGTEEDGPIFGECAFHWRHTHGTQCDGSRQPPSKLSAPDDVPHYIGPEDMDERAVECERRKWDALEPMFNGTREWHYDERPDLWLPESDLPDFCKRPLHYSGMWPKMQKAWRYKMLDGVRGDTEARVRTRARLRSSSIKRVGPNTVDARHRSVARRSGLRLGSGSGSSAGGASDEAYTDGSTGMGVGMRVQARYNYPVGEEYFRGTIESVGEDGTMTIRYDNGHVEEHVLRAAVMQLPEDVNEKVLPEPGPNSAKLKARLNREIYGDDGDSEGGSGRGGGSGSGSRDPRDGAAELKSAGKNEDQDQDQDQDGGGDDDDDDDDEVIKKEKPGSKPACKKKGHIACTLSFKCCWYQPVNIHRPMVEIDPPSCRPAGQCESSLPGDLPPLFVPPPPIVPPPDPEDPEAEKGGGDESGLGSTEGSSRGGSGEGEPPEECPNDMCTTAADCDAKRAECADVFCIRCIDQTKEYLKGGGSGP